MRWLQNLVKRLPTLLTALAFAIAVWIFAVTAADPTETRTYPQPVNLDIIGLDPGLMIVNDIDDQVSLTLRAPSSILDRLQNESNLINATLDLSDLDAGVHTLTPQVSIGLTPAEVERVNPSSIFVKLDAVISETFPIDVQTIGNPAIGFEVKTAELSDNTVSVSGPQSLVEAIDKVAVEVDVEDVIEDIQRTVDVQAFDAEGNIIEGVNVNPGAIQVTLPISQLGGYRSVVVKIVTSGQVADGYKITYIFALPSRVTIYSLDEALIEDNPGFVETTPINLDGANDDMEIRVSFNLPEGISVVGSQNVTVQVGIDPIESSISLTDIPIQFSGLGNGLTAVASPENVDVFLSGPLYLLEALDPATLEVVIDLTDRGPGTYQLAPEVLLDNPDINVDAILPNTIEVIISNGSSSP
ncbi:MAG: CdaR family protein [Chloroflexota bacterium]|nr:CdaR family protein [Chloroflexota bacterium]